LKKWINLKSTNIKNCWDSDKDCERESLRTHNRHESYSKTPWV
jgi:hypothetical protein